MAKKYGTQYNDIIIGTSYSDEIYAGAGNDIVRGGGGNDTINGEDGNDTLYGDGGIDTIYGGAGNDILRTGTSSNYGYDFLLGGIGDDILVIESGGDNRDYHNAYAYGDVGNDIFRVEGYARNYNYFSGGDGNDIFDLSNYMDRPVQLALSFKPWTWPTNINQSNEQFYLDGGNGDDVFLINNSIPEEINFSQTDGRGNWYTSSAVFQYIITNVSCGNGKDTVDVISGINVTINSNKDMVQDVFKFEVDGFTKYWDLAEYQTNNNSIINFEHGIDVLKLLNGPQGFTAEINHVNNNLYSVELTDGHGIDMHIVNVFMSDNSALTLNDILYT